ncbi:MAG: glycosyltransferase family 87 protein [Steroidobacteraceae bacterium]|jgi:hypothetical protein
MNLRELATTFKPYAVPTLVAVLVAGSIFYSGVLEHVGGARDIDARYFYIAAKCWISGHSPYDPSVYAATYQQVFGSAPQAGFVAYLPVIILICLPLAAFDWPAAATCLTFMNFLAAMILFWACHRLAHGQPNVALTPRQWFWVCLACTIGAISGSVSTGQTSVFVSAALALVLVGCRERRMWLTGIGWTIASLKPQLSGPLLLLVPFFEPRQRSAVVISVGVVIAACVYAASVDAHFVQSYLGSIAAYRQLAVNDPAKLIGLIPVAMHMGAGRMTAEVIGVISLAVALGVLAWRLIYSGLRLSDDAIATMLTIFSIGIAMPIQGYDLCCYAAGISLMSTQPQSRRLWLLAPILVIWRPHVWEKFAIFVPSNVVVGIAVCTLFFALLAIALAGETFLVRRRSQIASS